jgi:hypothetical protein
MQKLYGLIRDCGDGSSCMDWFIDKELVDELLEDDESYYANEGMPAEVLTFPENLDLTACGFNISTREDF